MPKNKNNFIIFLVFAVFVIAFQFLLNLRKETATKNVITTKAASNNNNLAQSKLGVFILSNYSSGAKTIIDSGPRVIKVMLNPAIKFKTVEEIYNINKPLIDAARDYKQKFPNGKVILRIYVPPCDSNYLGWCYDSPTSPPKTDPIKSADHLFTNYLKLPLDVLKQKGDLGLFDYIETPNEAENITDWDTPDNVTWLASFWKELAQQFKTVYGVGTCAGAIAVGDVGGSSPEEVGRGIANFIPTLRWLKDNGGAWCYHGYTIKYTTDLGVENWYSLRYRFWYKYLQQNAPDLSNFPMYISETGVDNLGNKATDGWNGRGTKDQFLNWLRWYDSEIQKDSYILGATIFQIGDQSWSSFNLEPIAGDIASYLNPNAPPLPTSPPGTCNTGNCVNDCICRGNSPTECNAGCRPTPTTIPGCNKNLCNGSNSYCQNTCGTGWLCTGSFCISPTPITPFLSATPNPSQPAVSTSPGQNPTSFPTNVPTVTLTPTPPKLATCELIRGTTSDQSNPKLNVVIMASEYSDLNAYTTDAKAMVNYVNSTNLGPNLVNKINFWRLNDLTLNFNISHTCNRTGGLSDLCFNKELASDKKQLCGGDIGVVLVNEIKPMGVADNQSGSPVIALTKTFQSGLYHELGHAVANLGDEYSFNIRDDTLSNASPNCTTLGSGNPKIPCPAWANYQNIGCYNICGFTNYFRATQQSIMNVFPNFNPFFSPPAITGWENALNNYQ